jgi:hypothetical protein
MEIKRVIAGGLAALAAGATLALGVGAQTCPVSSTGLGQLICISGNTMTSPYIVIGGNAAAEDTLAAADIGVALGGQATTTVTVPGAQGTMSVSNGVLIEGEAYKLYIGTQLDDKDRKPDLTNDDLPVVLAGGTVDHKNIADVDYSEYLSMGDQAVTWSKESEWTEPALNLEFDTASVAYTYKVVFQSGIDVGYITSREIDLLGLKYVFAGQEDDLTNTSLVLYAAGQTKTIAAGGSESVVDPNGVSHVIQVVGIDADGDEATITIDEEQFNVDETDNNYVTKGDLNVYVKSIDAFEFPAKSGSVQIFIGSEKLTLDSENDRVLTGNDEEVSGSTCNFTQVDGDKIYEIQITWTPDEEAYLIADTGITDGVFGAFKIAFGGIFPGLDADSKDVVEVEKSSSTKVKLSFENKAGDTCGMNVYYTSEDAWGDSRYNISVSQPSGTDPLNDWNESGNVSEKGYFLVNRGYDSYILQYYSTDNSNNLIKIKDMCSGTSFDASTTTEFFYLGGQKYEFKVNTISETIRVDQSGNQSAPGEQVPLFTAHKAKIELEQGAPGEFTVTEAPFSASGIQGASEVAINVTVTLDTGEVDTLKVDDSVLAGSGLVNKDDTDYDYGVSASGTYVIENTDSDSVKIYTPEIPTAVFVGVGADPAFAAGEGVSAGTVEQAVQIKQSVSKMESEVNTATLNRDLVLLGGPCANSLVAELLNMSSASGQCSTDFVAEYPTEGVISIVSDAFDSGQKALVIAGVDRTATRNLAEKVMQGTLSYSA